MSTPRTADRCWRCRFLGRRPGHVGGQKWIDLRHASLGKIHREHGVGVDRIIGQDGVLRLPSRSPDLNAYAERFVLSIKSECLNRIILFSPRQLQRVVDEYVDHYQTERTHQGLGNRLISRRTLVRACSPIRCRQRLGGLLKHNHREAA